MVTMHIRRISRHLSISCRRRSAAKHWSRIFCFFTVLNHIQDGDGETKFVEFPW